MHRGNRHQDNALGATRAGMGGAAMTTVKGYEYGPPDGDINWLDTDHVKAVLVKIDGLTEVNESEKQDRRESCCAQFTLALGAVERKNR